MTVNSEVDRLRRALATPPINRPHGVPILGTETPGRSPIYRHHLYRDKPLLTTIEPDVQSIHDLFEQTARQFPSHNCLGSREWDPVTADFKPFYTWISYKEVAQRRKNLGAGIAELVSRAGIQRDSYGVGIWSQNRTEWHITDLAASSQSLYSVSLYDTLGPNATNYIINHAELPVVACSIERIPALLAMHSRTPSLRIIICLDTLDAGEPARQTKRALLTELVKEHNDLAIYSIEDVERIGDESKRPMKRPAWDDINVINYTSGTTGPPKGVVLTQGNAVSAINCCRVIGDVAPQDSHLSYLPLAHIYGRLIDQMALCSGAAVGFLSGDVLGLVKDLKILRPTGFMSVPRLFNRFYSTIKASTEDANGLQGTVSKLIIASKKASMALPIGQAHNHNAIYDALWTSRVRSAVGLDRARVMISGSAFLDPNVQQFLSAALAVHFRQGYGMTESFAAGTTQIPGDYRTGTVGPPMPNVEMCLASVPDYNYHVDDKPHPRGEILLRGPSIFREYYKNAEETDKSLDTDGWFHSGDIGEIDDLGCFKIIDRKKNVLKLAHGEYISPERIESAYLLRCELFASAYVHGDPNQACLVAIFGMERGPFAAFASTILDQPLTPDNDGGLQAACNDPKVQSAVMGRLEKIAQEQKFNSYERVRGIRLAVDPFTVENGLLTPSQKLKRPVVAKEFRSEIESMYAEVSASSPTAKLKL